MIDRVVILALAGSTLLGALLLLEWDTGQPAAPHPARGQDLHFDHKTPGREVARTA